MNSLRALLVILGLTLAAVPAAAQAPASNDKWKVTVYPLLAWIPIFGADVNVPDTPSIPGGGEGAVDKSLSGALTLGFSIERGPWRVDADGMWAGLEGDRVKLPKLTVNLDVGYVHASGGRKVVKDLYVTGGVRGLSLKYDINIGTLPTFTSKPALWDPLIGLGWHHYAGKTELHATLEGGGFGIGADVDVAGSVRFDWKPISHFGITLGYGGIYLKVSEPVLTKTFTASQSLHGPIVGIGLYF